MRLIACAAAVRVSGNLRLACTGCSPVKGRRLCTGGLWLLAEASRVLPSLAFNGCDGSFSARPRFSSASLAFSIRYLQRVIEVLFCSGRAKKDTWDEVKYILEIDMAGFGFGVFGQLRWMLLTAIRCGS